jgi:GntR family transcriptional regulator
MKTPLSARVKDASLLNEVPTRRMKQPSRSVPRKARVNVVGRPLKRVMKAASKSPTQEAPNAFAGPDKTPKYLVMYHEIVERVQNGSYKPGQQLPAELDLARAMQVSLGTAQKALKLLADHGVVVRRHGHGTFVAGAAAPRNPSEIRNFRFLAEDGRSLLPVYTRVLELKKTNVHGVWSELFPEERDFVLITRVININLEFQNYSRLYLPNSRFGSLLHLGLHDLDGAAMTHFISERFRVPTLRFVHHLWRAELPPDVCRKIEAPLGTIGTEWEILGFTYADRPVSYQHVYMPPHNRRLELRDVPP